MVSPMRLIFATDLLSFMPPDSCCFSDRLWVALCWVFLSCSIYFCSASHLISRVSILAYILCLVSLDQFCLTLRSSMVFCWTMIRLFMSSYSPNFDWFYIDINSRSRQWPCLSILFSSFHLLNYIQYSFIYLSSSLTVSSLSMRAACKLCLSPQLILILFLKLQFSICSTFILCSSLNVSSCNLATRISYSSFILSRSSLFSPRMISICWLK